MNRPALHHGIPALIRFVGSVVIGGLLPTTSAADSVRVAAASSLQFVTAPLEQAFAQVHPEIDLAFVHAASGNLVAQIRHGAPFEVFLSADLTYPQALIASGHAVAKSLTTMAHGSLVLWPAPAGDWREALRSPAVRRLVISHPDTTPYGAAAMAVLARENLLGAVRDKLVIGENAAQALQFVHGGNADHGLIAAALLQGIASSVEGRLIPAADDGLPHGAVLLARAQGHAAPAIFLHWLTDETAREILQDHGYRLP